jgi:hypothetical protein
MANLFWKSELAAERESEWIDEGEARECSSCHGLAFKRGGASCAGARLYHRSIDGSFGGRSSARDPTS